MSYYFNTSDQLLTLSGASLALLILAMTPICIGSFISLRMMQKPTTRKRRRIRFENGFEDETEERTHVISTRHALFFPVIGFVAIFYTYLALKTIRPEYINEAITIATSIVSTALFSNTILLIAKNNIPRKWLDKIGDYKFCFSRQGRDVCQVHMTIVHLLILALSIALTVAYIMTEHWILGDLFAICLITNIVGFITVDSFWAGLILMCGVLLHDFMWISGAETIVNISESFSGAPTNIVWPRNIETFVLNRLVQENQLFTMLSIIDIIIPGIFIAYCLRFDQCRAWKTGNRDEEFPKPFYQTSMVAYAMGTGASIFAAHLTKKSQSALFYIMPALLASILITAIKENNLKEIINVSPVVESLEKKLHMMSDPDQRPDRFASRSSSGNQRKNGKSKSRSVSRRGKRSGSSSKVKEGQQSMDIVPITPSEITVLGNNPISTAPIEKSTMKLEEIESDSRSSVGRTRRSSRVSQRKRLDDYL